MIHVQGVSKSFGGIRAVRDVTFEVARGEVVGLLGANGAGKSTTIRMVTGFVPADSGSISINGFDTLDAALSARRQVGYLPESAPSYAEMTTRDYLDFRGRLYGMPRPARRAAIDQSLARCDLADVARRRVGQLSRGYRQRVGLAAAIMHDPPVLVLDEPTSALDPRQIRHVRTLVRDLAKDKAVLVSSHILPEVEQTCDRIVVMARGRIRLNAKPRELLAKHRASAPLVVQVKGDGEAARRAFASIEGVASVEAGASSGNWHTFTVRGTGSLEEAVGAAAVRAGLGLRELTRAAPSLERIFLELIEGEEDPGKAEGGA
ncbi:MAG: ABC transporter ATP-binding protein [Phycisphaeraceae bacterium]|nr:ABC transporter ATP-binding protein [Phycisphaeraceae bacterium]